MISPSGPDVVDARQHQIRVYCGSDDLDELCCDWRALDDAAKCPTEQFIWIQAAANSLLDDDRLLVVTVWRDGQLRAAAPLAARNSGVFRQARLLGVNRLWEPMDFPAVDDAARTALVNYLLKNLRYPLRLDRTPADSRTLSACHDAARGRASVIISPQADTAYIPLGPQWAEPESQLNPGRRSDLRRAVRRAEQLGRIEVIAVAPRAAELAPLLDDAFAVEASGWKGAASSALACDAALGGFFRRYAVAAAKQRILRLFFLRIGGVNAAMQIAVETQNRLWLLKIGYLQRFAGCSPGALLLKESIAYAVRAGLEGFEFLGQAESWTDVWTQSHRRHVAVRTVPWRLEGLAALACDAAQHGLRRWRQQDRQA